MGKGREDFFKESHDEDRRGLADSATATDRRIRGGLTGVSYGSCESDS